MSTLIATTVQSGTIKGADGTNTALTISNDGTILPQKVPTCLIYANGNINPNLVQTTWTGVNVNTTEFDTHSMSDLTNNRIEFTTTTAGVYMCIGAFRVATSGSLARFILRLQKNSTQFCQGEYANNESSNNKYPIVHCMGLQTFSNGDNLNMAYYLDKSTTTNGDNGLASCQLACYRVSA